MTNLRHHSLCALVAIALLAGCGGGSGSADWVDAEEVVDQVETQRDSYQWPESVDLDSDALVPPTGEGELFEAGYEVLLLEVANVCAWFIAWLEGDDEQRAAAIDHLRREMETFGSTSRDDATLSFHLGILDAAELGDASGIRDYVVGNGCREYIAWQD